MEACADRYVHYLARELTPQAMDTAEVQQASRDDPELNQIREFAKELVPRTVLDLFNQGTSHNYNLRNADFSTQRFNTIKYGKHTLSYFGPYLWSRLSNKLRLLSTLTSFKSAIRKIDLDSLSSTCANCVLCNS